VFHLATARACRTSSGIGRLREGHVGRCYPSFSRGEHGYGFSVRDHEAAEGANTNRIL
jgi:hypothetical protein